MATQEFYIRNATETEARGPFTHEHLVSLAETGQITRETLYYEASNEQWVPLSSNTELMAVAFPEKASLKLKAKTKLKTLNVADDNAVTISVDDMLAAAEGRTADTQDKLDPAIARERAAAIGLWSAVVLLLISASALILPYINYAIDIEAGVINTNLWVYIQNPQLLLGLFQGMLSLMLVLQVTQIYPLIRFSAVLTLGFMSFLLWTQGQTMPLASFVIGSAGLYFCTVFINFMGIGLAAGLGLAGMGGYAFFALTS